MLGSDEEFAGEGGLGGTAFQGFFRGQADQVRIVVFLRDVGEDQIAGDSVEAVGVGKVFADGVIRKMTGAAEDALLDEPRVWADFQHVEIVIGFEDEAVGPAEMNFDELGHVAKVGDEGHFCAVGTEGEADGIGGIVRDGKRMDLDVTDAKVLPGVNGFDTVEALSEGFGKNALHLAQSWLGDVKRRSPDAEHLRQAAAVVGVLVGDEDAVEMIEGFFDGGEAGQGFALAQAGVHEEAGALGLE